MSTSTSHPLLNYSNNNNNSNNGNTRNILFTSSRGQTCSYDKSTQTPESIERETRRQKFRSLKINFNNVPTPTINFKLSFLNHRKRTNLSANAVATEQKATKVRSYIFYHSNEFNLLMRCGFLGFRTRVFYILFLLGSLLYSKHFVCNLS